MFNEMWVENMRQAIAQIAETLAAHMAEIKDNTRRAEVRALCEMMLKKDAAFSTKFHQRSPYTCCRIIVFWKFDPHDAPALLEGVGFSRCGNHDRWNEELGRQIALDRAIADVVDQIMTKEKEINDGTKDSANI